MITVYLYSSCWNVFYHCAFIFWFLSVLILNIYMWSYFHLVYIRRTNVSVPAESRYYKISPYPSSSCYRNLCIQTESCLLTYPTTQQNLLLRFSIKISSPHPNSRNNLQHPTASSVVSAEELECCCSIFTPLMLHIVCSSCKNRLQNKSIMGRGWQTKGTATIF